MQVNGFWLVFLEKDKWIKLRKTLNLPFSHEHPCTGSSGQAAGIGLEQGRGTQPSIRAPGHLQLISMKQSQLGH